MTRTPKDPRRAEHRTRERASRERRGLYEARLVIRRCDEALVKAMVRRLKSDPGVAQDLRQLLTEPAPGQTRLEPLDLKRRTVTPKVGRKHAPDAALRDLFD